MASATGAFKGRDEFRKAQELEEARKAGLAPAALDEEGKEINPHIPQYMAAAPWYLNNDQPVRSPGQAACGRRPFAGFRASFGGAGGAWARGLALTLGGPRLRPLQSLKHQKNWKAGGGAAAGWYDRGAKTFQASKYRKGACEKCAPPPPSLRPPRPTRPQR